MIPLGSQKPQANRMKIKGDVGFQVTVLSNAY